MHEQTDLQATQYIIDLFEKSKAQADEFLDYMPGIYCVVDAKGQILKGNKTLAQILGSDFEDLLGRDIRKLFIADDAMTFEATLKSLSSQPQQRLEFRADLKTLDGSIRNYLWTANGLSSERREVVGLFSILGRDVTDLTEATVHRTRMQAELTTARTVQESLFLEPQAKFKSGSICGFYEPANECGGDWWHYGMINEKLFLWIGDVTGHGVPAALVVSAVNAAVALISTSDITPARALSLLNKTVYLTAQNQLAMTFFVASIDFKTRECIYSSAAHEPALLFSADKATYAIGDVKVLEADPGYPLGLSENAEYKEQSVQLAAGDRIVLYTDGLREVANPEGRKWRNLEFLRNLIPIASTYRGSQDLVVNMKKKIEEYRQGAPLADDATMVTVAID